jgi:hypothetical protein
MIQHAKTHDTLSSRQKDKLCVICNALFFRTADLNRHLKTHSGMTRKAYCLGKGEHVALCGKVFSRPDAIERHRKRTKCVVCNGGDVVEEEIVEDRGHALDVEELHVNGLDGIAEEA